VNGPSDAFRRRRLGVVLVSMIALSALLLAAGLGRPSRAPNAPLGLSGDRAAQDRDVATAARRPTRLTVAATGDLLIHGPVWERARSGGPDEFDFRPMFRYVRNTIARADLGICHMETPLTTGQPAGYPVFAVPADLAPAIKSTGWDVCTTASNHTLDRGQQGINATLRALDGAGLAHTGSFRSPRKRAETTMLDVKGVKIALLAYTDVTNGVPLPHRYSLNLARARQMLADARVARQRGAQVVIVSIHWGAEYQHRPTTKQRRLADALTRSPDVTAVIGQHAHVVQPIRRIHGKPVVFGEGNLLSNQSEECCPAASQDGLIALLDIAVAHGGARVASVRYVPTFVRHPDFAVLPVRRAIDSGWGDRSALRESYRRTRAVVGRESQPAPG
jgi:hypothetical protein